MAAFQTMPIFGVSLLLGMGWGGGRGCHTEAGSQFRALMALEPMATPSNGLCAHRGRGQQ